MNINKNLMSINHTALRRNANSINWIVIHYVGALGDAKANTDYYKSTYVGASADFWVGFNGDIWQGNDYYNYYSWHCGGGLQGTGGARFYGQCTNSNSIGIEMCVRKRSTATMNATDRDWYFESATIESTAWLTAKLMKELSIDINHVIRHFDVNSKLCPAPFVHNNGSVTWDGFKNKVMQYYNNSSTTVTSSPSTSTTNSNPIVPTSTGAYGLKILASELNIRTDAGTGYPIISNTQSFYRKGDRVSVTGKKLDSSGTYWFKTILGYISGKYVEGWLRDSNGKWWYVKEGYTWITNNWLRDPNYGNAWYYFGADGYMVTSQWVKWKEKDYYLKSDGVMATNCYIKSTRKNLYYWVDENGVWDSSSKWDTPNPDLKKYSLVK